MRLTHDSFYPPVTGRDPWSLLLHPRSKSRPSKTGDFDESVLLDAPWALRMAPLWHALSQPGQRPDTSCVWTFSYHDLQRELKRATDAIGISLVPYQARHSGASHDRLVRCRSLEEVRKRGRWLSFRSVGRYEKAAMVAKTWASYKEPTKEWLRAREAQIVDIVYGRCTDFPAPPFNGN